MAERWILAIDLGNGGPKVGVVTLGGEIAATSFEPVSVEIGLDGTATQDPLEWWNALVAAARTAIAASSFAGDDLHAVAVTGQWGTTVCVDADGQPVGQAILWADTRGGKYSAKLVGGPVSVQGYAPQ
ncbi:MAG: carbohydrate kinase, partial [Actinobacteria bacterium]|nr:carbohydrate kinase [Actinomycetota bacterium]